MRHDTDFDDEIFISLERRVLDDGAPTREIVITASTVAAGRKLGVSFALYEPVADAAPYLNIYLATIGRLIETLDDALNA